MEISDKLIKQLTKIQELIAQKVTTTNSYFLKSQLDGDEEYIPETICGLSMSTNKKNTDLIHVSIVVYSPEDDEEIFSQVVQYDIKDDDIRQCKYTENYIKENFPEHHDELFPLDILPINGEIDQGFPYIPGFLAFREVELFMKLYNELPDDIEPELFVVDGNGKLHPRMAGLGCHFGVMINKPVIGVAKDLLSAGSWDRDRAKKRFPELKNHGDYFYINDGDVIYGAVWRTPTSKTPIYISSGHKIDIDTAIGFISKLCFNRIPEPVSTASSMARRDRVEFELKG